MMVQFESLVGSFVLEFIWEFHGHPGKSRTAGPAFWGRCGIRRSGMLRPFDPFDQIFTRALVGDAEVVAPTPRPEKGSAGEQYLYELPCPRTAIGGVRILP